MNYLESKLQYTAFVYFVTTWTFSSKSFQLTNGLCHLGSGHYVSSNWEVNCGPVSTTAEFKMSLLVSSDVTFKAVARIF